MDNCLENMSHFYACNFEILFMYFNFLIHRPCRSMGRNFWQNKNKNKELTEMKKWLKEVVK